MRWAVGNAVSKAIENKLVNALQDDINCLRSNAQDGNEDDDA